MNPDDILAGPVLFITTSNPSSDQQFHFVINMHSVLLVSSYVDAAAAAVEEPQLWTTGRPEHQMWCLLDGTLLLI